MHDIDLTARFVFCHCAHHVRLSDTTICFSVRWELLSNRMFLGSLCRLFFQGLENFLQALDFFLEAHEE